MRRPYLDGIPVEHYKFKVQGTFHTFLCARDKHRLYNMLIRNQILTFSLSVRALLKAYPIQSDGSSLKAYPIQSDGSSLKAYLIQSDGSSPVCCSELDSSRTRFVSTVGELLAMHCRELLSVHH